MKVAVIGSRNFTNYSLLECVLGDFSITQIVSGGAKGADKIAEWYSKQHLNTDPIIFEPDWDDFSEPCLIKENKYGKYNALAGHKRNTKIVEEADLVIAFWDGQSKGTKDSIDKARERQKPVYVVRFNDDSERWENYSDIEIDTYVSTH